MSQKLHLKANSRGSWANVLTFERERLDDIQDACESLCSASGYSVSFKITDDHGVTLASLDARDMPTAGWANRIAI